MIIVLIVDLFCGAGGVTEGFEQAKVDKVAFRVVAGVNHDQKAIESHAENHPNTHHFVEDVRDLEVVEKIKKLVDAERRFFQHLGYKVYILLHASLECTNFSNAKGGKPRDGDSRSLADCMPSYIQALSPDYFTVENVREFMSWGPLDENGKPISRKRGCDYVRWTNLVCSFGYKYEHRLMNAADFGAYTSRLRYYALFHKYDLPSAWPVETHAKNPRGLDMFGGVQQKWRPVRDVLDLSVKGESIFTRKTPLVEKTLERIYAGLLKHVSKNETGFLQKNYSGSPSDKVVSLNSPAGTITSIDSQSVVSVEPFLTSHYSGNDQVRSRGLGQPCPTLTTAGQRHTLVTPEPFLMTYYGGSPENRVKSLEEPCLTVTTENRHSIVTPEFLFKYYGNEKTGFSTNQPCGTVTTNDRFGLVQAQYLITTNHGGYTHSIDNPCPVIIARQDKAPISVATIEFGSPHWKINPEDSLMMQKIKKFMVEYSISDIRMRMLMVDELLRIQGFPHGYKLKGSNTDKKKFIGNSVVPLQMKVWGEALGKALSKSH